MSQKYRGIKAYLIQFLKEETFKTGLNGGILILDHRVESAVVAILAKEAFGNRFMTLITAEEESAVLENFCRQRDIRSTSLSIEEMVKGYPFTDDADAKRRDIFVSRVKMAVLYDMAERERALVLGSKNKSALLLGEGTMYGDLAYALNPIGDLYQTEVTEFAEFLGVEEALLTGMASDAIDEESGHYEKEALDSALKAFTEERLSRDELLAKGYDSEMVEMMIRRIYQNQFKQRPPIVAKLTSRTIGHDLQYPRDIKL